MNRFYYFSTCLGVICPVYAPRIQRNLVQARFTAAHDSPPEAGVDCVGSAEPGESPFTFFLPPFSPPPLGGVTYSNFLVSRVKVTGPYREVHISQPECYTLAHCNHTSFVKLTSIMAPN